MTGFLKVINKMWLIGRLIDGYRVSESHWTGGIKSLVIVDDWFHESHLEEETKRFGDI